MGRTERVGKSDALSLSADGGGAEETLATSAGAASSAGPAVVIAQSLLDLIDEWRLTGYRALPRLAAALPSLLYRRQDNPRGRNFPA